VELYERAKQWPDGAHRYPISVFGAKQIGYAYQRGKGGLYQAVGHVPEHRLGRQNTDYDEVIVENGALYVVDAKRLSETRSFINRDAPLLYV
jgi:CMP-N-acetylneuraminic acid synthetase